MQAFENFSLANLVRYALTGVVALAAFIIVPWVVADTSRISLLLTTGGAASVAVFGVATGFILDALKVYQLIPGYRRNSNQFFTSLAATLEVDRQKVSAYFSKAAQLEKKDFDGGIFFLHARWVMMNILSTLFWCAGFLWGAVAVVRASSSTLLSQKELLALSLLLLLLGIRLIKTANQERGRVNAAYTLFCKENREIILAAVREATALQKQDGVIRDIGQAKVVSNEPTEDLPKKVRRKKHGS